MFWHSMLSEKHLKCIIFQPFYPESLNMKVLLRPKVIYLRSCPRHWKIQTWLGDHLSCLIFVCTWHKMNCHCGKASGLRPEAGMHCPQLQPTTIGERWSLNTHITHSSKASAISISSLSVLTSSSGSPLSRSFKL